MFRCSQSVTSACLLGTHKSLFTALREPPYPCGGVVNNGITAQLLCVVRRGKGWQQRRLHHSELHRLTCISQEARHGSLSRPVNTNSFHNLSSRAAGPLTSSQFVENATVIHSPKISSSEHLILRDSIPAKCLPLEHHRGKHSCSARTWIPEQNSSVKNQNFHTVGRVTPKFNRSHVLSTKFWTPCPVAGSHYRFLRSPACGVHSRVARWTALEECLSPQNESRCKAHLQPNAALYEKEMTKTWAAVLVCLCTVGGEPAFLFTLRSSKLRGKHKGDVSFAGGKRDPADRDVVDTALREACEELGVAVTQNDVWGLLKPLRDRSGMLIAPVLANLGPLESLTFHPNPSEVEEIFTLTVAHLCDPLNRGYTHFRTGDRYAYTLPVFHSAKHRVWGLTAVALEHTLRVIMPV